MPGKNILNFKATEERVTYFLDSQFYIVCQGKHYPGQLPPRPQTIEPRRTNLPPDIADEWKKIGSKRRKFADLGLPLPKERLLPEIVVTT